MTDATPPSPKILYPEWQNEFRAALLELDRKKLLERVTAAETAIFNRVQAILRDPDHAGPLPFGPSYPILVLGI